MPLHAYIGHSKYLRPVFIKDGTIPPLPLIVSATPMKPDGTPLGLCVVDGNVYSAVPDGLPAFIMYDDGGVEIRTNVTVSQMLQAKYIISGSAVLIHHGKRVNIDDFAHLSVKPSIKCDRIALGIRYDKSIIIVHMNDDLDNLQIALQAFGCEEAIMSSFDTVYLNDSIGGIIVGNTMPVLVLEAVNFKDLPRPIIVLDAGHGGSSPGCAAYGMIEKNLTLTGCKTIYSHLIENYECTVLMTRVDDVFVSLEDRTKYANAIKADFFLSRHTDSFNPPGTGFSTFVWNKGALPETERIRQVIHKSMADYLVPFGIRDRGMKKEDFYVLRETTMPAVLVECLFINHPNDSQFLKNPEFNKGMDLAIAEGIAKALNLKKKVITPIEPPQNDTLYRVQVGAFKYRQGADQLASELRSKGYEALVVATKKPE